MSSDDNKAGDLNIGRETLIGFVARFFSAFSGFIGVILFTLELGFGGSGTYYVILYASLLASRFCTGTAVAIKKRISERGTDVEPFYGLGLLVVAVYSILAAVVVSAITTLAPSILNPASGIGVVFFVFSFGLFSVAIEMNSGLGNPGASSWIDGVRSVLTLLLQVSFLRLGFGVPGLLYGLGLATFFTGVGTLILVGRIPSIPDRSVIERTYDFATYSIPNDFLTGMFSNLDTLVIGIFLPSAAAGAYTAADRLSMPGGFFAGSISAALVVKSSMLSSAGKDVLRSLDDSVSYAGMIAIPVLFGAATMPDELITILFQEQYPGIGIALVGMATFQLISAYRTPYTAVLNGTDKPWLVFRINAQAILVNVPLAVLGVVTIGLNGVVLATIVSETVRLLLYQRVIGDQFGKQSIPRPIGEQFAAGVIMMAVVFSVQMFIPPTDAVSLIVSIGVGAFTYFTLLIVVSQHFRTTVTSIVSTV